MKERAKTIGMCVLAFCVIFAGPVIFGLIERLLS